MNTPVLSRRGSLVPEVVRGSAEEVAAFRRGSRRKYGSRGRLSYLVAENDAAVADREL